MPWTRPSAPAQRDLLCPSCAGQCVFSPERGGLACQSCGAHHPILPPTDKDAAAEFHYDPALPHTEQTELDRTQIHQCQTCGGGVVFTGPQLSERCAYCDGTLVLSPPERAYDSFAMVPFAIPQAEAQARALAWIAARRAAPVGLRALVAQGRVAGIYVPFWTFDSKEAIQYLVRYRVRSGKDSVTRTKQGAMQTAFDDMLMPASPHVTPLIRDGILHDFDPAELRVFDPAYLAGFAAERHHQSVTEGLAANEADKDILIRNQIKHHSRRSNIIGISYKTHTSGIRYRRILLPVWILHYTYNQRAMKVVVCGLHGRTFGERPFSGWKLWGYSAALSAAVIAFGLLWGALGAPS